MHYRIGICDDDIYFLDTLKSALLSYAADRDIAFDIHCYLSGEDLLAEYDGSYFHLLLLDWEMKQLTGIETAQMIRQCDTNVSIIYATTHEDFALDAFRVNADAYLIKPVTAEKLYDALDRIFHKITLQTAQLELAKMYITLNTKEGILQLAFDDILYISKQRNYLIFHTVQKEYFVYMNLKDIMKKLDVSIFVQINKGQIVNWHKVQNVYNGTITVDTIELPISRSHLKRVTTRFESELEHLLRIRASESFQEQQKAPFHKHPSS